MEKSSSVRFVVGLVAGGLVAAAALAGVYMAVSPKSDDAAQAPVAVAQNAGPIAANAQLPANHPPLGTGQGAAPMMGGGAMGMGGTMPAAAAGPSIEGKVVEVMQVPNYTYLRLETAQGEVWAAVPTAEVKQGATVGVANAAAMDGFHSKTLNKTFDRIMFGTLAQAAAN